jgi:hypothetical protein
MALLLPLLLPRIFLILCALVTMAVISFIAGFGWCAPAFRGYRRGFGVHRMQGHRQTQVLWRSKCIAHVIAPIVLSLPPASR